MEAVLRIHTYENHARLLFHLNAISVIQISDMLSTPMWEIDTRLLVGRNRHIGAQFRIRWNAIWPEPNDTIDQLRAACGNFIELIDTGVDNEPAVP